MPKPAGLPTLNLSAAREHSSLQSSSPVSLSQRTATGSPRSPRSVPVTPRLPLDGSQSRMQQIAGVSENSNGIHVQAQPSSPGVTAIPEIPSSPGGNTSPKHNRDPSKSFFSNLVASKSSHRLHATDPSAYLNDTIDKSNERSRGSSRDRTFQSLKKQASTPDMSRLVVSQPNGHSTDVPVEPPAYPVPPSSSDGTITSKKSKSKLGGILNRSRGARPEDEKRLKSRTPTPLNLEVHPHSIGDPDIYTSPKTAPLKPDHREKAFRPDIASMSRNRSADRIGHEDGFTRRGTQGTHNVPPSSLKETSLFSNISQTGRGVGDRLGKAGKGLFNKMTRSGSTNERELVTDENYVCTTIYLPLIKQTRKTRIAKKLELSHDKTEFWMPALPWRCIDYLNMQCEEEGLYRIPGSGRDVKLWQRRFDTEYDINLFEEPELYDINTIGSMFKAWLRELPDEILPKTTQNRIAQQCAGAQRTPQLLKDELSKLPPFNYYLLFAITCHLSLLHSYSDKNKMDYRNLCICFQPCLKIDAFCFQFLVIDWKECWQQGCWTEKEYLEEEYRYEREGSIKEKEEPAVFDERAISSSGSSQHVVPVQGPKLGDGLNLSTSPPLRPKQRSLSSSAGTVPKVPGHGHAQTAPVIPRLVTTPEPIQTSSERLPEVGNLSPIRM